MGAALRLGLDPLSTAVARAKIARIGRETRRRRKRALELSGPENADHALRTATAMVGPLGLRGGRRAVRDFIYRKEVSLSDPLVRSEWGEGRDSFKFSVQEAASNIEHVWDSNDRNIQGEMKPSHMSDVKGCWWLHLCNMMNESTCIHQSLNRSLLPVAEDDLGEDSISGPVPSPGGANRRPNTSEQPRFGYDGGKVATVVGSDLATRIPPGTEGKTFFFSGKGELTGARSTGGREYLQAEEKSKVPPPPSQIDHPISRMTLLRELQARIDGMSLAEEYETSDTSNSVDFLETEMSKVEKLSLKEEALVRVTGASSPPVAPFFLGASGSLLTELIDSLDRSADVDCIVHESTNTS